MPKTTASAQFPTALVTTEDIGQFTNFEGVTLANDEDADATVFNVEQDPSDLAAHMFLLIDGPNGWDLSQVDSVDANAKTVTVERDKDGTVGVAHKANHRLQAVVPAISMNQMREEIIAVETHLGIDGGTITWDRNLILQPTTTDGTYPLTIDILSGHSDPEPLINFRRSTDSGSTYSSIGSIDYDPTNDQMEFSNIEFVAASGANILLEDDQELRFGTEPKDYWFTYDSAGTRFELNSTDVDGGGSDGLIFHVDDGGDAVTFYGDLLSDADDSSSVGSASVGWANVYLADDAPVQFGADQDHLIEYDSANAWLQISDGTNDALRIADSSLNIDIVTGALQVGGTTLFENDRDFAVDLIPNADGTLDVGSPSRTLADFHSQTGTFYQGLIVNEDGGSNDLRVESSGQDPMLEVTGAQDQVNVHTSFNADWGALNVGVRDASAAPEVDMVATLGDGTDSADIQGTNTDVWGVRVGNPTINSASGATTVTNSAALYVPGPVQAGTDVTITNQYVALMEDGGGSKLFRFTAGGDFTVESGSIGVGETSPLADLHVTNDQASLTEVRLDNTDASGSMAYTFYDGSNERAGVNYDTASALLDIRTTVAGAQVAISTAADTEAVRVDASQNVDIVTGALNMAGSGNIQDAGTDAIAFDGSQNVNLPNGTFSIAGTTLFENDRDVAVDLLPNADASLDLGSATRNWKDLYLSGTIAESGYTQGSVLLAGSSGGITEDNANLFWDDSQNRLGVLTSGPEQPLDVRGNIQSKNTGGSVFHILDGSTGSTATRLGEIQGRWDGSGVAFIEFRSGSDTGNKDEGRIRLSTKAAGGVKTVAVDVNETQDVDVANGTLQIGGTTTIQNDRDWAVDFLPDTDDSLDLGSLSQQWQDAFLAGNLSVNGPAAVNFGIHQAGGNYAHLGAPSSGPTTGNMENGSIIFHLDETNDEVEVTVKYSGGTVKTGTLAVS